MIELKKEDVKRDNTLDELIRIDYRALKKFTQNIAILDKLMAQVRLYKKYWEKIFSYKDII